MSQPLISTSCHMRAHIAQLCFLILLSFMYMWSSSNISQSAAATNSHHLLQRDHQLFMNNYQNENASSSFKVDSLPLPHRKYGSLAKRQEGTELHTINYKYKTDVSSIVCGDPIYLLTVVMSSPDNFFERDYFRKRWKTELVDNMRTDTVFIVANSKSSTIRHSIYQEYKEYKDILYLDFEDDYRNLTLKTMLSLRWAVDECQPFKYILKTDDDMIVNFDVLVRQLLKLPPDLTEYLYTGYMWDNAKPMRRRDNKFFVSYKEYPQQKYPDYMNGPGYVLSYKAATKVVEASYRVPFMTMEDVFVGLCAKEANITGYSNVRFQRGSIQAEYDYCHFLDVAVLHHVDFNVRELYYFDKMINSHRYDFESWGSGDVSIKDMIYIQNKSITSNVGYPMIYRCSNYTWYMFNKSQHSNLVKRGIPQERIIDL